jgi:hypothetical protein
VLIENPTTYGYDPSLIFQNEYNNVDSYTIDTTATDYGKVPTSGWTNRATVTGNKLKGRAHIIEVAGGFGMLRIQGTVSAGSAGNADWATQCEAYKCPASGRPDVMLILGDSNTANQLPWYHATRATPRIGKQVYDLCGTHLGYLCAGWPGVSMADMATTQIAVLRDCAEGM